ncbi:MAG TPA: ABC transporter permease [Anaerolineales bacterium]|nr:ABC transporter permease [Anaerolineales bacterium]
MAVADLTEGTVDEVLIRKERSLWEESFIRLRRNKVAMASAIFLIILVLIAIFANNVAPFSYAEQDLIANNTVPSWMIGSILPEGAEGYARTTEEFALGADSLGRDLLSRTIYGARVSLSVAFVAASVSLVFGTIYGMVSGYLGGRVDDFMMRLVDFLYAFPVLIVVILLQTYFKALARRGTEGIGGVLVSINETMGGLFFLFVAIGLLNWLGLSRIARGQVLSYKQKEFVEAAHAVGASDSRIVRKHLFPNILGPLIVYETLAIPGYIFLEAFLSFIGLGVDAPTPSWGIMISEAASGLRTYPNQVLVPAIALSITVLAFNFLGDGLRDAFDPRMKQ